MFDRSVAASLGFADREAIAAAKAGLECPARSLAATHGRRGVRCHCVAPALVEGRMTAELLGRSDVREAAAKLNPSGLVGAPADVARAMAFLPDPADACPSGQVPGVSVGQGALRPLG